MLFHAVLKNMAFHLRKRRFVTFSHQKQCWKIRPLTCGNVALHCFWLFFLKLFYIPRSVGDPLKKVFRFYPSKPCRGNKTAGRYPCFCARFFPRFDKTAGQRLVRAKPKQYQQVRGGVFGACFRRNDHEMPFSEREFDIFQTNCQIR